MLIRRSIIPILAVLVLLSACFEDDGKASSPPASGTTDAPALDVDQQDVRLQPFDSCDQFTTYMKSEAKERVGDRGLPGVNPGTPDTNAVPRVSPSPIGAPSPPPVSTPPADPTSSSAAPSTASTTAPPTTVPGGTPRADDADVLAVSGTQLVAVVSGRLQVVELASGLPVVTGTLVLPDNINDAKVVVTEDRALVVGRTVRPPETETDEDIPIARAPAGSAQVALIDVDLSNPAQPAVRSQLFIDGTLLTTRRVGESARVVFYTQPFQLPFVTPATATTAAQEQARRTNEQIVNATTPDDWRPRYLLKNTAGGTNEGIAVACELVHRPSSFAGFGLTSVLTLDLKGHLGSEDVVSVLGDSGTIHASDRSLLITSSDWLDPRLAAAGKLPSRPDFVTALHAFDLTGVGPSAYAGSTGLRGHLAGSTPLYTTDVAIRAATVEGPPWVSTTTPMPGLLTTVDVSDGQFLPVSTLENLGGAAGMLALRYAGDVGYLVTGRSADPLTLIDLRVGHRAAIAGAVPLPLGGSAARLFPFGPGRVVGIGPLLAADGTQVGLVADLYTIADPRTPVKEAELVLPSLTLGSPDDRAVLLDPTSGLIGIPARTRDNSFSGMVLVRQTPGALTQAGQVAPPGGTDFSLHRAVVVGQSLVSVSPLGVQTAGLSTLTPAGFQAFPPGT